MATKTELKNFEKKKQELLERLREVKPFENDTPSKKRERIKKAESDFFYFCDTYFPHYFGENKRPGFHHEWYKEVERTGSLVVPVAAPRGHAKSTVITFGRSIHAIVFKREPIVTIVSDTNEQAVERVAEIRHELENNERLKADFGEFNIQGTEGNFIVNHADIEFGSVKDFIRNGIKVRGFGSGQKIRGLRMRQHRPRLIICDDLENDKAVESEEQRKKLFKWFTTVLIPALHPESGRIFIVGTILHYDSLLMNLIKKHNGKIYTAVKEDGTPLWPERFKSEKLAELKETMGTTLFEQEYMNNPLDEDAQVFKIERIAIFLTINEPTRKFRYIDPAVGKNKKSDYVAVVNGEVGTKTKTVYITDVFLRKTTFAKMMDHAIEDYKLRGQEKTAMEAVAFQEIGKQWLDEKSKETGVYMPLVSHIPRGSKESRIESLVPLMENGTIRFFGEIINNEFRSPIADMKVLIEQFIRYPKAKNDDGPDGVAGLMDIIRTGLNQIGKGSIFGFKLRR